MHIDRTSREWECDRGSLARTFIPLFSVSAAESKAGAFRSPDPRGGTMPVTHATELMRAACRATYVNQYGGARFTAHR